MKFCSKEGHAGVERSTIWLVGNREAVMLRGLQPVVLQGPVLFADQIGDSRKLEARVLGAPLERCCAGVASSMRGGPSSHASSCCLSTNFTLTFVWLLQTI